MNSIYPRFLSIVVLLAVVPLALSAQDAGLRPEATLRVEQLATSDGFSGNTVYTVMQDRHGFLWFGTRNGLVKYDGYGARTYLCADLSDTSGPPDCIVSAVAEDSAGYIWAGTLQGGLYRLDRRSGLSTRFSADPGAMSSSAAPGRILSIVVAGNGSMWHVNERSLMRYDARTGRFVRMPVGGGGGLPESGNPLTIFVDRQGALWVCSSIYVTPYVSRLCRRYVSRYEPALDRFTTWSLPSGNGPVRIIGDRENGELCISPLIGAVPAPMVQLFDPRSGSVHTSDIDRSIRHDSSTYRIPLLLGDDGRCWYARAQGNRGQLPGSYAELHRTPSIAAGSSTGDGNRAGGGISLPLASGGFHMLFRDRSGTIWAATDAGVLKIMSVATGFTTWRHDSRDSTTLSASRIRSVFVDRAGLLWVATDHGLNRYDRGSDRWRRYYWRATGRGGLPHNTINVIHEDPDGRLLLGTPAGVAMYNRQADDFSPPDFLPDPYPGITYPWAFLSDSRGQRWIGDRAGHLTLLDSTGRLIDRFVNDPLDSTSLTAGGVWCLLEDSHGVIWIGTNSGLCRWIPGTKRFQRYTYCRGNARSLRGNSIWALSEDSRGNLWVCVYGGGISCLDRTSDDFTTITTRQGLPSNYVFGLLEDDHGMFWISTSRGLVRWNQRDGSFRTYDRRDGLQGDEFTFKAFFKAPDGTLYFGGTEGLTAFRPELLRDNRSVPPVFITRFQLFDSLAADELHDGDSILLDHTRNFLSFEFAALDYTNPGKNNYMFRLEGVDREWVAAGSDRRVASYTELAPGTYTFRVRGSNNDDIWNEQGIAVTVVIAPPWWGTWWLRSLATVAVVGLCLAAVRGRINLVRRIEREKQQSALHAALESQEAERQRIARDLHDGVGQMLAAAGVNILHARKMMQRHSGNGQDAPVDASLERSLTILERATADVRAISHGLGTSTLRELGLHAALGELLGNLDPHQSTRFEFEMVGMEKRLPDHLEVGLFRVAQELIANVLHHSGAGEATVQIVCENDEICLTVEDNGAGFDMTLPPAGMGRGNIEARISVLNGRVHYDSAIGHGTTVLVNVPLLPENQ